MNATDLCIIIDNDPALLRHWLRRARISVWWTFHKAEELAEESVHRIATARTGGGLWLVQSLALIALRDMSRSDWREVADHYAAKVAEGASVPEGDA